MSKKIKNMLSILFVAVLTVSAFCIPASAAEDDLTISISTDEKDSVTAKVGDTVKYAIYMTDTKEEVIGAAMSFFYNDEYLKLNADSINCESFKNAIGNPKLKNFYTFTWTDVQAPVKLNGDKALVSAEFKVLKGGKTDLSYFISDRKAGLNEEKSSVRCSRGLSRFPLGNGFYVPRRQDWHCCQ